MKNNYLTNTYADRPFTRCQHIFARYNEMKVMNPEEMNI